ncbi:transglutaminase family protein [Sphingomonas sp.]
MRILVDHRTRYAFSEPQHRLVQLLRMSPGDSDEQTVIDWRIHVDCDARLREHRDGFGNRVTMLYAEGPIEAIEIAVQGEVLTSVPSGGAVRAPETLPPPFYLRDTEATRPDAALVDLVREAGEGIEAIVAALREQVRLEAASGDTHRPAAECLARGVAHPREMAQLAACALRVANVPARYVSGYHLGDGVGCAPHGWIEAYGDDAGWHGFDPWLGQPIDERHVRVAIGLDMAGTAPVAGSRLGPGKEMLDVDLRVDQAGGGA